MIIITHEGEEKESPQDTPMHYNQSSEQIHKKIHGEDV